MTNTFDYLYTRYKNKFIHNHGQAKFETVQQKVLKAKSIAQLKTLSLQQSTDPSQADFGAAIHSITYFIFSSGDTCAMAEFIATKHWDETVNNQYEFCDEDGMYGKGKSILNKWHKTI